ncbi:paired domain-containing protein [Caerostris extrusa]|uniref:Paired domain-containing protein n=1 Tax=Caerostris extrusa TaxID=172846 RepID=A0AAV4Y270_CAEEX|nr:paired domain-containing protein [Caerostris extrusa]
MSRRLWNVGESHRQSIPCCVSLPVSMSVACNRYFVPVAYVVTLAVETLNYSCGLLRDPEAPKLKALNKTVDVKEGNSALLELSATGFPKPVITWNVIGIEKIMHFVLYSVLVHFNLVLDKKETGSIRPGVIGGNRPKGSTGEQEHKDECKKDSSNLFSWEMRERFNKETATYSRMLGQTKLNKDDLDGAQKGSGGHKHSIDGILSKKRACEYLTFEVFLTDESSIL